MEGAFDPSRTPTGAAAGRPRCTREKYPNPPKYAPAKEIRLFVLVLSNVTFIRFYSLRDLCLHESDPKCIVKLKDQSFLW